jgi:hypothetical protein
MDCREEKRKIVKEECWHVTFLPSTSIFLIPVLIFVKNMIPIYFIFEPDLIYLDILLL